MPGRVGAKYIYATFSKNGVCGIWLPRTDNNSPMPQAAGRWGIFCFIDPDNAYGGGGGVGCVSNSRITGCARLRRANTKFQSDGGAMLREVHPDPTAIDTGPMSGLTLCFAGNAAAPGDSDQGMGAADGVASTMPDRTTQTSTRELIMELRTSPIIAQEHIGYADAHYDTVALMAPETMWRSSESRAQDYVAPVSSRYIWASRGTRDLFATTSGRLVVGLGALRFDVLLQIGGAPRLSAI